MPISLHDAYVDLLQLLEPAYAPAASAWMPVGSTGTGQTNAGNLSVPHPAVTDRTAPHHACKRLAGLSPLFRPAAWASLPGLEQDVLRLNLVTVTQREAASRAHAPRTIEDAISQGGRIAWVLELYLFGAWLLGGGADHGPISGRGRKADRTEVLRFVAAGMLAVWRREENPHAAGGIGVSVAGASRGGRHRAEGAAPRPLSRTELSRVWRELHGEQHGRDWFKSRMTSSARYLTAYLDDLAQGRTEAGTGRRLVSPQLHTLLPVLMARRGR